MMDKEVLGIMLVVSLIVMLLWLYIGWNIANAHESMAESHRLLAESNESVAKSNRAIAAAINRLADAQLPTP